MNPDPTTIPPPDRRSFSILAREHHRGLLVYGRALSGNEATAADLVQDAFVTAWKNLSRFDVTRDFGSWMRGIVRNKWREHLKRHRREVDVDDATLEIWESRFITWDDGRNAGKGDPFEHLEDCLGRLPEAMREAVHCFYYKDTPGESVADSLGIDPATLRKRLQRSRETLRHCLEQKHQTHS